MKFFLNILFNTPIVEADKVSGGYVAYYHRGEVVSQGETKQEALENLKEDIRLVKYVKKA